MQRRWLWSALLAFTLVPIGCSDDGPTGGSGGPAGMGGIGGAGGSGGEPSFQGFAVAPPPSGDEFKQKRTFDEKLSDTLANAQVPSAFAGAFVRLSRAYLSGRDPEGELEEAAFATLDGLDQSTKDAIARVIEGVDALPAGDSARLYGSAFVTADASAPLTTEVFTQAVVGELRSRLSLNLYNESDPAACIDGERPGLPRVTSCPDIDANFDGFCNAMCLIDTDTLTDPIRTAGYRPFLDEGDLLPEEVEQECTVNAGGGPLICSTVQTPDCKYSTISGSACAAVPVVQQGAAVTLQGFNFFDVDATVILVNTEDFLDFRELPAHVCGDVDAGAQASLDCNAINDRITFTVPGDLAPGLYRVSVIVPNNTGDPTYDRATYGSIRGEPAIEVVPPENTEFELLSEELYCIDESGADIFGSDEVGLSIIATLLSNDGSFGPMQSEVRFDFGDVDSGNRRRLDRRHFRDTLGDKSVAVAVIGYEIDNREAYEQEIRSFSDAYKAILASNWSVFAGTVGTTVGGIVTLFGGPALGAAVAAAITFAIQVVVALWAPADLIMEDNVGISFVQMAELTSPNFPNPPVDRYSSPRGIDVTALPCEDTEDDDRAECEASAKTAQQYRERRVYGDGSRGSDYQITFRYRRVN